ncbi:MAG TPA: hypothetical protein VFG14_15650 [Chthoniobacteraceae bacterium]|nr:hypothetical protein [Chthoniobacteraceae bacterium]
MTLEARVTPIWKKQKLFVALFMIAFGAYFYYDGAIGWPRNNERFAKYQELSSDHSAWVAYAKQRGWSDKKPEKAYTPAEIQGQFIFGTLCTLIGLVTLGYWAQQIGRRLKLDDEAVVSPSGTRVPFDSITGLGLKKWESKGLATVRYEINGRKGQFVVDDYKFDPETTRKILDEVKRRLESRTPTAG